MKTLLAASILAVFLLYHSNSGYGPDSSVYRGLADSIYNTGTINMLPDMVDGQEVQVTGTFHAPIHQNPGGVLFILPATILARFSVGIADLLPGLPARFYETVYHEDLWQGGVALFLALISSLLLSRVGCLYHSRDSVLIALVATFYGGPLLIYSSVHTCGMNLPALFLASLLLFVFHFADKSVGSTWMLMGAIWSLGVFIRSEFVLWGGLLAYGLWREISSQRDYRQLFRPMIATGAGCLLFLPAAAMLREIIYGTQVMALGHGAGYANQFDFRHLLVFPEFLFGWRNGLFSFWPVFLLAISGYLAKPTRNPPLYHILVLIMVAALLVFAPTVFWSGELGYSFGQRNILVIMPVFVLLLARLFDNFRAHRSWLLGLTALAVCWSLLLFAVFGQKWFFPDGSVGLLMVNDFHLVVEFLRDYFSDAVLRALALVLYPRHFDVFWFLPLGALLLTVGIKAVSRITLEHGFRASLVLLVYTAGVVSIFLLGAGQRGEKVYREFVAANPETRFVQRNFEIDNEMLGSFVDTVAYYLEQEHDHLARYFQEKGMSFLRDEAPDMLPVFAEICEALRTRRRLGWIRLVPEQNHFAVHRWYLEAKADMARGHRPPLQGL